MVQFLLMVLKKNLLPEFFFAGGSAFTLQRGRQKNTLLFRIEVQGGIMVQGVRFLKKKINVQSQINVHHLPLKK